MTKPFRIAAMTAAAVAGVAFAMSPAQAADSLCWFPSSPGGTPSGVRQWPSNPSSPTTVLVYVSASSTAGVQRSDYDPSNVALATQTALERWNEQSGTTLRLAWGGLTENDSPDGILVQSHASCSNVVASASPGPGTGFITKATITLMRFGLDSQSPAQCDPSWPYAQKVSPQNLVDVMVHELGHTMGRNDAYFLATNEPNACGQAHSTIMTNGIYGDLSDFDRTDHQSVYGSRAPFARLEHRTFTTMWGSIVDDFSGSLDVRAGSGSSFQSFETPVPVVQLSGSNTQIAILNWRFDSDWNLPSLLAPVPSTRRPVSASYSPTGTGIIAYVVDSGTVHGFKVCHRLRNTDGSWGAESCLDPNSSTLCGGIFREGVSTAYDPVSTRFLIVNACNTDGVLVRNIPQPTCTFFCWSASAFVPMTAAEGATIACSDYQALGEPLRANCRLVWADRSVYGQPVKWRTVGATRDPAVVIGSTELSAPGIFSDHAPSVTWFKGQFRMAVIRFGRDIDLYKMLPTSSTTSWSFERRLNSTGWVSPPTMSPTRSCSGSTCTDRLSAFWLRYQ